MSTTVTNSANLLSVIEDALEASNKYVSKVEEKAGISNGAIYQIRKRGGSMTTDTLFALAKVLGLTITIEKKRGPGRPPKAKGPIEDIKISQVYGWVDTGNGKPVWAPKVYDIMLLRNGSWSKVPVEHVNPKPPKA